MNAQTSTDGAVPAGTSGAPAFLPDAPQNGNPPDAVALQRVLARRRSIRRYKPDPIPEALLDDLCRRAILGTSSSGNMNLIAIVRTRDSARRARLRELHSDQPMVTQAPLVLTFCADVHRMRRWLALRGARPNFDNLLGYHVALVDAVIVAQSLALLAESHGLGICYMGTTLHSMAGIAELLELPTHVVPITSLVVGWPDEAPDARDRLPQAAYVHDETYRPPTDDDIGDLYEEREVRGWARYQSLMPERFATFAEHGIENLAQFYTSDFKYSPQAYERDSAAIRTFLERQGFAL